MSDADTAATINDAMAEEAPRMPSPIPGKVELMRGLHNADDNKWHTVAHVRELNGVDEEQLAALGSRDDIGYGEYMNEVLKLSVESIGDLEVKDMPDLIDKLIIGDRDVLFLQVLKTTYGRTKEFQVTCRYCGEMNDVEIDMDEDFQFSPPDIDLRQPFDVKTKNGGVVSLRLPTGETTSLTSKKASTDAEINSYLLATSVVTKDDTSIEERLDWARALPMSDRQKLVKTLGKLADIGPKMQEVNTQCAS